MSSPLVLWSQLTSGFDLRLIMLMCSLFSKSLTDGPDLPLVSSWSITQCFARLLWGLTRIVDLLIIACEDDYIPVLCGSVLTCVLLQLLSSSPSNQQAN